MSGINERCKGFAISSHGIFFCDDRRKKDYFLLHEFVNVKISKSMSFLRFGTYEFNVLPTGKIENLMFALQNEIAAHL